MTFAVQSLDVEKKAMLECFSCAIKHYSYYVKHILKLQYAAVWLSTGKGPKFSRGFHVIGNVCGVWRLEVTTWALIGRYKLRNVYKMCTSPSLFFILACKNCTKKSLSMNSMSITSARNCLPSRAKYAPFDALRWYFLQTGCIAKNWVIHDPVFWSFSCD